MPTLEENGYRMCDLKCCRACKFVFVDDDTRIMSLECIVSGWEKVDPLGICKRFERAE